MTRNEKGEYAVLKVIQRAIEKGFIVSRSMEYSRYDLVVDDGKKLWRVQVKYAGSKTSHSTGAVHANLRSRSYEADDRDKKTSYGETVDAFAVYVPQADKVVWLDAKEHGHKEAITLRYEAPKKDTGDYNLVSDLAW